jgi:hypothetical protein
MISSHGGTGEGQSRCRELLDIISSQTGRVVRTGEGQSPCRELLDMISSQTARARVSPAAESCRT